MCVSCSNRCSFEDVNWNINSWPSLVPIKNKIRRQPKAVPHPHDIDETRSIFYEDILPFERALSDPTIPRTTLKAKARELREIAAREKKETEDLVVYIQDRVKVIGNLEQRLRAAGAYPEEQGTEKEGRGKTKGGRSGKKEQKQQ